MDNMYMCPVCGFIGLHEQPYDDNGCSSYEICPCCGFEFGYDDNDQGMTFDQYRKKWIINGALWCYEKKKPVEWSLKAQLKNIEKLK